uniref:RICIN domain-containing protein n=1 Tax=Streptomyces sp. NRRL B-3229 TaxID=1463836 RepID=UPI00056678F4
TWAGGEIRVYGDKCLDAYNQGTTDGTRVIIWTCNGQNNQKWTVGSDGTIRNVNAAGLCLDTDRSGTANGTALQLRTCNGQAGQKWSRV